jgi:hypothetical protein
MNWLALVFALEIGILPNNGWIMYDPFEELLPAPEFYQQLETRAVLWDHLFIGGQIRIYDWLTKGELNFWPSHASFLWEGGLSFGMLELGWRHFCTHPILPYLEYIPRGNRIEGGYDEVYLRLEGKIGGQKAR